MLKHKHSDVGVAVAMPGGLITPIIRNAETQVAVDHFQRDEGSGGPRADAKTRSRRNIRAARRRFPISACSASSDFTAVINPPQSTILAVGASEERAVVRNGKIEAAHIMSVTLSCDHRAVDGALGAELIGAFRRLIENPVMMMV